MTKPLTVDLSPPLAERLAAAATRLDRPEGWVVDQTLSAWVTLEEERHRMTLDALAAADAGRVVDGVRVQAWADSLSTERVLATPFPSG